MFWAFFPLSDIYVILLWETEHYHRELSDTIKLYMSTPTCM